MARVFRVPGPNNRPIITNFPDDPPDGSTDLEVRMKHFTEIETFTFLGFVLAHELHAADGNPHPITAFLNVEVPDRGLNDKVAAFKTSPLTNEQLADELNDNGLNWEHFVASTNTLLIPGNPLHITDVLLQEKIDSLEIITEGLVREINSRSVALK